MNLENQGLVIKSNPAIIGVLDSTALEIPILGDKVVIRHTEDAPLIIIIIIIIIIDFDVNSQLTSGSVNEQNVARVMAEFNTPASVAMEQLAQSNRSLDVSCRSNIEDISVAVH
jgi:hypothetical protein